MTEKFNLRIAYILNKSTDCALDLGLEVRVKTIIARYINNCMTGWE